MNDSNSYNPYSSSNYQRSAYPSYSQNYGTGYNYQNYNQTHYENTGSSATGRADYASNPTWDYSQAPQSVNPPGGNQEDAVANEMKQQKAQLHKQREDYVKKVIVLRRELELLRNQKHELVGSSSPPRDLDTIVRENEKLQEEIQTKMKAITNVIEMLSNIIKDGLTLSDLEHQLKEDSPKKSRNSKSPSISLDTHTQFNYVHYDPELHWCRMCDKFPKTAKEFLMHLQNKKHQESIKESDVGDNTPWHKLPPEAGLPQFDGAPKKRIPIKGLQFFISAPSWYCKLCDVWIGDLHCASHHLKSQAHFQNYQNFIEQNPHWEMEWLKDREKALSRADKPDSSDSDNSSVSKKKKKKKDKKSNESNSKDKKKKKRSKKHKRQSSDSSSSSSSSPSSSDNDEEDKSRSIRVAMRNVKVDSIMQEDLTGKWEMLGRLVEEHKKKQGDKHDPPNDSLINQWMTVHEPPEKEKYLLDSLKDRMKQKHSLEKAKYLELEKKQKERELKEREELDRRQREEKEAFEQRERERKEQERLEYERILNKDRNQVKFKPTFREKNYRKNVSPTPSPDREREKEREREREKEREREREREREKEREREREKEREREREREREYEKNRRDKRESRSPGTRSPPNKYKRYSRDKNGHSRSRSRSKESDRRSSRDKMEKKQPGPPSYKKLPFIGRMPLFKHKKPEDKVEKEIQKEEYDKPRQTRFEPGNLPRAFIPEPDVVCFPKLSSYPELTLPPPAPKPLQPPPPAPKITEVPKKPPPPPKIEEKPQTKQEYHAQLEAPQFKNEDFDPNLYEDPCHLWNTGGNGYEALYPPMFTNFAEPLKEPDTVPIEHMMPLQPPPMPPGDDDLALLGISADDMAAQSF